MADETTALARSKPHYLDEDFDTIHEAVLETARGRWFLQEYARRNRAADTEMLLAALARIESAMAGNAAAESEPAPLPDLQLLELRDAIALTRDNLAALGAKSRAVGNADFASVAMAIGNVAARLRAALERLQETAWTLRDRDGAASLCDALDAQARELAHASGVLDEVGAGAAVMGDLLNEVDDRIGAMIAQAGQRPATQYAGQRPATQQASPWSDASKSLRVPPQAAEEEPPAEAQSPAPQAATSSPPEPGQDEAGGTVILAFDPDYERTMSEAVEAALLSEHEGAEWHLPAGAENVAEPAPVQASAQAPVIVETSLTKNTVSGAAPQTATRPDLSDQVFEALSAEAAPPAPATAAQPRSELDAESLAWIESLAPAVRSAEGSTSRPFEDIEFPLASGKSAAAAPDEAPRTLPNIASFERDDEPQASSVTAQVAATVQDEIEAAMADIRDAVQARLCEDIQPQTAKPARPADLLAPIMALSDEEKIALFS